MTATSENAVQLFDLAYNSGYFNLNISDINVGVSDQLNGVRFAKTDPNVLFLTTTNGKVYQHDLRAGKAQCTDLSGRPRCKIYATSV